MGTCNSHHTESAALSKDNRFDKIGKDVLLHIVSYLDTEMLLCRITLLNKRWHSFVDSPNIYNRIPVHVNLHHRKYMKKFSDKFITKLVEKYKNIVSFDLRGCTVTDNSLSIIATNCPNLETLNMSYSEDTPVGCMDPNNNTCDKITDTGLSKIALRCPKLKILKLLAGENLQGLSVISIIYKCPDLITLEMGEYGHTWWIDNYFWIFMKLRSIANKIQNITVVGSDTVLWYVTNGCKHLKNLTVTGYTDMTDYSLHLLGVYCPNLESLKLQFFSVTDITMHGLQLLCHNCLNMKEIECFHFNRISNIAVMRRLFPNVTCNSFGCEQLRE